MTVQLICSFQLHISTYTTTNLRSHPIRSFSLSNRDQKGSSTEGKETELGELRVSIGTGLHEAPQMLGRHHCQHLPILQGFQPFKICKMSVAKSGYRLAIFSLTIV